MLQSILLWLQEWPSTLQGEALFVLQLIVGTTFLYYHWRKIKPGDVKSADFARSLVKRAFRSGWYQATIGPGMRSNAEEFKEVFGLKPAWLWSLLVIGLECFGGLAVLLGTLVPIFTPLMVVHMTTGAILKVFKLRLEFSNWSYDLLLGGLAFILFVFGAGPYGLSAFFGWPWPM